MMVVDSEKNLNDGTHMKGKVLGICTSRDLLRQYGGTSGDDRDITKIENTMVETFMTPIKKVVYIKPEETVRKARDIMAKIRMKALPIISKEGRVEGIVTARDITDYGISAEERGGKQAFLKDMVGRVGINQNTSVADPPTFMESELKNMSKPLNSNVGSSCLPHPFKTTEGIAGSKSLHGPAEYSTDVDLSEDASFIYDVEGNNAATFAGVADGVGSWREYGVDPRAFSRELMGACVDVLESLRAERGGFSGPLQDAAIQPKEILRRAHEAVIKKDVVGSSTACVMLLDGVSHQIHFSNLGDSGIIVMRHIDSNVSGILMRDR